ncbi:CDP-diacylglycerol--serine O-phosphatidyltransferase [Polynucleobacter paneuropaeus]|uniref:CDP-diacylglycerol--serine O-phosphatidyltransferase n=1 Tax=Polynucleobacter paludilacus TaxID=1855895 RepID=UPI001BFE21FE|nr:CDP-diacylglycerol--serine O-phosphatidyltransferase [Polynucleobacter paludilacus]QWD32894.1 CDP-diacylglycerol--serine O-phosphatidyltransferase [Polynucleobacter paneuropaeus]QWD86437.1 CDP-diacylglycerol--serine O-phosphatidyltransferase [Polynucleobacter paludilacus]
MPTFRRRGRIERSRTSRSHFRHPEDRLAAELGDPLDYEVEEIHPVHQRPRNKGIYLLPNAFTTAALFSGFFAIVNAMNHEFGIAAIAIFASLVLDGMDGRIARMTNTQSAFGEQYDSLADMVSFGVAPALVAYEWVLKDLGKWGWLAAFTYCAGAALRLARFNVNTHVVDKRFFQGLPSPAAGSLLAGFIWLADDNKIPVQDYAIPWVTFLITVYAGLTMVSNAKFYSGKALDVRYRVPFGVMVLMILGFVLISTNPPLTLFGFFVIYSVSGYVIWAWEMMNPKRFG